MSDDRIQALVSGLLDRMHSHLQQELDGLADGVRAPPPIRVQAAADASRAEAESVAASRLWRTGWRPSGRFSRRSLPWHARKRATAHSRPPLPNERVTDLARADRLLTSVRALDAAESLSEVLDALAEAAAREAGRAVVLLVRGDELSGWRMSAMRRPLPTRGPSTLAAADAGLFERRNRDLGAGIDRGRRRRPPPFTLDDRDRTGIAVPLIVDDRVVALVYADDGGDAAREVPSAWPEHVELLARHGSRCLEALTARQSVRGRPGGPRAARRHRTTSPHAGTRGAHVRDQAVSRGCCERRTTCPRHPFAAREQIARARGLYDARVPRDVRTHGDFFEQELVRTLADGDAALLGQAS